MEPNGENRCPVCCVGMLAHVDAGKTTLSEALLYTAGALRRMGRVDHGDAFLDTDARERERGITIFSKQARLRHEGRELVLLDTPGHVDFSAEMERTLPVLDCAVLVISGSDGVQSHTRTLWRLLERYHVPVVLFINKMDLPGTDKGARLSELRRTLSENCLDMAAPDWMEQAAAESEEALESYLSQGSIAPEALRALIRERKLFPCFFGAALRGDGVEELLSFLSRYAPSAPKKKDTGALVYKISRDPQGARITWLKVTGGQLRVKDTLSGRSAEGEPWEEKIHQLRLYSGDKFELTDTAEAGQVCALTGLNRTFAGEGIGSEADRRPVLEPVFTYTVTCPNTETHTALENLRRLQEEDPLLRVTYEEELREIRLRLMGPIQMEILSQLCRERFGMEVEFGEGKVLYKETIASPVEGVGHYEPLRHYAEVHLLLAPGERGSGLHFASQCSTDDLDLNWQRLILTHLGEKTHRGVLIGAPITDMTITLAAGRAHPKHTEGGDFRQATYRAVRQGLMSAESILLEPWYDLRLELPAENVGRAMTDIQRMGGDFDPPETVGDEVILTGTVPVAELGQYHREVIAYTRGRGRLSCSLRGYEPCRNTARVRMEYGYDPERDVENTPDSVFCSHGAGYVVKWDQVRDHMHLESCLRPASPEATPSRPMPGAASSFTGGAALDKELQKIFERTYGPAKERSFVPPPRPRTTEPRPKASPVPQGPEYLLVDGYNIIFAWEELRSVAEDHLDAARQMLTDILCNYRGLCQCEVILVFDAYRVPFHKEEILRIGNIYVVYTREAETADAYIEKTSHEIAKNHRVRVATSDGLEQLIVLGQGALRLSAEALHAEVFQAGEELQNYLRRLRSAGRSEAVAEALRRAEKEQ